MAVGVLEIKKNDLQPYYYAQVKDSDSAVVGISGATIRCTMKAAGGAIKIDRQTAGINITDATNGKFEYQWQSGDTDTVGKYYIEFEITPSSGGKFTLPPNNDAIVMIFDSLDTT